MNYKFVLSFIGTIYLKIRKEMTCCLTMFILKTPGTWSAPWGEQEGCGCWRALDSCQGLRSKSNEQIRQPVLKSSMKHYEIIREMIHTTQRIESCACRKPPSRSLGSHHRFASSDLESPLMQFVKMTRWNERTEVNTTKINIYHIS